MLPNLIGIEFTAVDTTFKVIVLAVANEVIIRTPALTFEDRSIPFVVVLSITGFEVRTTFPVPFTSLLTSLSEPSVNTACEAVKLVSITPPTVITPLIIGALVHDNTPLPFVVNNCPFEPMVEGRVHIYDTF